ncbi:MAG TPA: LL-diaminopimelate aminotransferase [Candidatus Hydrogenedentes bacterium]|nr:LL-diaminopimelate aminotransferase [Candidatus Hydrogenedentota bacterium]HOJ68622.1 LL-diaminopimelate aminotransferase [Candidatus Hydrogenedentota bacterium]HOK88683.1 LL-diaminopimelate aminotransferase [Candidatus Hydrogenedentota bacterium]
MKTADRLNKIPPYLFMTLRDKIRTAREQGIDVISLAIGDPVEPTPPEVVTALCEAAHDPANHRYPTDEEWGMRPFREAVARWYARRYGVELNPASEIVALIGSKEGCHHFALAVVNPGDLVLVTDPGYPGYKPSVWFAGGEPWPVPMRREDNFLPRLEDIPTDVARKASAFYLNYPNNPTGAVATRAFLDQLVEFARSHDIAVCYDNPYSEIVFEGERLSFLNAEGAKSVGVELNSLSKPFNMTGWRIGMACGNPDLVKGIATVKANTDSGIFNAIQYAGIEALDNGDACTARMLDIYAARRERLMAALRDLGWTFTPPPATFYVWVPVPEGHTSASFCDYMLDTCAIVLAPGAAYGACGEGWVRFSLTVPDDRLDLAIARMRERLTPFRFA